MKTQNILDHTFARTGVETRRTLRQRAVDVAAGFNGQPFTVGDFVCSAQRDGVTDHRDMSVMLRHVVETFTRVPIR